MKKQLSIENGFIDYELFSKRTYSTFNYTEIQLSGKTKQKSVAVYHTYCPFCGKKYDEPLPQ